MGYFRSAGRRLRAALVDYLGFGSVIPGERGTRVTLRNFFLGIDGQQDTPLNSSGSEINRAKLAVNHVRSCSPNSTPIAALPPEMLSRIFSFTVSQPCGPDERKASIEGMCLPKYQDTLAHVCSSWRSIAISYHPLWTHIDLSWDDKFRDKRVLARAETYLARSGKLPIEIHILRNTYTSDLDPTHYAVDDFLRRIAGRMDSLQFYAHQRLDLAYFLHHVFEALSRGPPMALTRLAIQYGMNKYPRDARFARAHAFEVRNNTLDLHSHSGLVSGQIENIFTPLKILHLCGVAPRWSSNVYCGLTDLRLSSSAYHWFRIDESTFITILRSSPTLQILHFELDILLPSSMQQNVAPVDLPDLQVVKISQASIYHSKRDSIIHVGNVLRLLAPGTKPLNLWIDEMEDPSTYCPQELENFFARSKVRRFYYEYGYEMGRPPIATLLRHGSHLEVLVLNYCIHPDGILPFPPLQHEVQGPLMCLNSLYLMGYRLHIDYIRIMLDLCPNGVVLYDFTSLAFGSRHYLSLSRREMLKLFPAIRIPDDESRYFPFPITDWDILD